jgi:hypothetical protein
LDGTLDGGQRAEAGTKPVQLFVDLRVGHRDVVDRHR